MADIRPVTPNFAVAPQLTPTDMAEVAARGFKLVINNRPDGEAPGQPAGAEMERTARAAGLDYLALPVVGGPTRAQAERMQAAVQGADGPTLAFCRSGTRSITAWALGQAMAGARSRAALAELAELAAQAGYDVSAALG